MGKSIQPRSDVEQWNKQEKSFFSSEASEICSSFKNVHF